MSNRKLRNPLHNIHAWSVIKLQGNAFSQACFHSSLVFFPPLTVYKLYDTAGDILYM